MYLQSVRRSASGPNGRASFANRDFCRELLIIHRKVIFSATVEMQMKPPARGILRVRRKISRDRDSLAERSGFEPPRLSRIR